MRSLIDRDIVQPFEGVYRLAGDIGEPAVPDSLHALLAARLDALDREVRHLVEDAAVLGTTFHAEALIAVSREDATAVRAALDELVRREVLTISVEPLSPERGSYSFAQNMLRQVAYDTLSRRDRKARHLAVAAHLRAAFAGDGEEVTDVIARHYLDALNAVHDDPDTDQIRGQAIAALIRAAERAERTGAPALAAASYATAAGLTSADVQEEDDADARPSAGMLWERAARAANTDGDYLMAVEDARRAREYHLARGQARAAARTQAVAGRALHLSGHLGEAREQLTAAVQVLRAEPDTDTVDALNRLALVEAFADSPDADRLSTEALTLGQALGVDADRLSGLLLTRGIYLRTDSRHAQAIAYYREAARLANQVDDKTSLGRALLNLSDVLAAADPAAAAEAARTAAGYLRRTGARDLLAVAVANMAQALLMLGEWDAVEAALTRDADGDGLADNELLACYRGWLAALRGDSATAQTMLTALPNTRASENPLDKATVSLVEAFTAAARRQPRDALRLARGTLAHADAIGISDECLRWAWPLAARAAYELGDTAAAGELLALLDACQPGHLALMQRAERDLVRARLAAADGDPAAGAVFAAAIGSLRELSTPYHLAHGLLDYAGYLTRLGNAEAATAAIAEARDIADNLRCQPLRDQAATIAPEKSRAQHEIAVLPDPEESPAAAGLIRGAGPDRSGRPFHGDAPQAHTMLRSERPASCPASTRCPHLSAGYSRGTQRLRLLSVAGFSGSSADRRPISSSVSATAASCGDSPASIFPPGNVHGGSRRGACRPARPSGRRRSPRLSPPRCRALRPARSRAVSWQPR